MDYQAPGPAGGPPAPGWWLGRDERWYPPELHPSDTPLNDNWWQAENGQWFAPLFHPDNRAAYENYIPPVPPSPPPAAQIAPVQTTFAPNLYPDPPTQPTAVVASRAPAVSHAAPPPAGPQAPLPRSTRRSSAQVGAAALTAWEGIWYVLMCIPLGAAYFTKIPAKKALSDFGLVQMTSAEQFWYVIQCIFCGAGYFAKIPTAKALSELPQFQSHVQANLTELDQ